MSARRPLTRKRRRLYLLAAAMVTLGAAAALILNAFEDSLVFFYTPTEIQTREVPRDRPVRLGGLVAEGSVVRGRGEEIRFAITDLAHRVEVVYRGILPDLFREGQGVVAQGTFRADGTFAASEVLAKHDETYMPREVADALRESGRWQGGAAPGGGETP